MSVHPLSQLTQSERTLIELVVRYRTLTLELLPQFLPTEPRDALRMRAERLCRKKWLVKTRLATGEPCYALGTRAQRVWGLHHRRGFGFSSDGVLQHLGMATFCALAQFRRLHPEEFYEQFADTYRAGLPAQNYSLDLDASGHVAWLVVDHASEAKRFPGKVFRVVASRLPLAGFQRLIAKGRFSVAVITATPEKRARIIAAIEEQPPSCVKVSVTAIPSLLQFMW